MKSVLVGVSVLIIVSAAGSRVDLVNLRVRDNPKGPERKDNKVKPGDALFFAFEIKGLVVDPKSGKVHYEKTFELSDAQGKILIMETTQKQTAAKASLPDELRVQLDPKLAPGMYLIRMTVRDKSKAATFARLFSYKIKVLKK